MPGSGVVDSSMMVTYEMIAKAKHANRDTWSNSTYLRERAVSHIFVRQHNTEMVNGTAVGGSAADASSEDLNVPDAVPKPARQVFPKISSAPKLSVSAARRKAKLAGAPGLSESNLCPTAAVFWKLLDNVGATWGEKKADGTSTRGRQPGFSLPGFPSHIDTDMILFMYFSRPLVYSSSSDVDPLAAASVKSILPLGTSGTAGDMSPGDRAGRSGTAIDGSSAEMTPDEILRRRAWFQVLDFIRCFQLYFPVAELQMLFDPAVFPHDEVMEFWRR